MIKSQILIVEDDYLVAEDIQNRLKRLGFGVSGIESSGEETINRVKEDKPDLVLMDIMLHGEMDGIEAADRIRSRFHTPVVFITAFSAADVFERAKRTRPFGYIIKPVEDNELY